MKQNIILKSLALIACLLCSLRAAAYVDSYACYTPENTTLTYYFDNQRSSRTGTTYDLNEGDIELCWFTDGTESSVTKVVFNSSFADARPTTTFRWFHAMGNLESITGLRYLNTCEVTKMIGMFYRCTNLRTIYVGSGWSTAAVTDSNDMFRSCSSLVGGQGTAYDVNHLDVSYAHIDGGPSNPGYFTDKNAAQPGDINGDGFVNVADVTELISLILNSTSIEDSLTDVNGDGQVNVADVTALIRIILNQ